MRGDYRIDLEERETNQLYPKGRKYNLMFDTFPSRQLIKFSSIV